MKFVRSVALSRTTAPDWVGCSGPDLIQLRKLQAWIRWLYIELRAMSDIGNGRIETSYARLVALMDCDSGGTGGPKPFKPGLDQIRRALEALETLGLVLRDKTKNEGAKRLFLQVMPPAGISALSKGSASSSASSKKRVSACQTKKKQEQAQGVSPEVSPGGSVEYPSPISSSTHSATEAVEGENLVPPRGDEQTPPTTPPSDARAKLRKAREELLKAKEEEKQAPQRGRNLLRQGATPPRVPKSTSAPLQRPMNTGLEKRSAQATAVPLHDALSAFTGAQRLIGAAKAA